MVRRALNQLSLCIRILHQKSPMSSGSRRCVLVFGFNAAPLLSCRTLSQFSSTTPRSAVRGRQCCRRRSGEAYAKVGEVSGRVREETLGSAHSLRQGRLRMPKSGWIIAIASMSIGFAVASGAEAQGTPSTGRPPSGLSTPQTRQDARETKELERGGAGAGQNASEGQTLRVPQPTTPPQPTTAQPAPAGGTQPASGMSTPPRPGRTRARRRSRNGLQEQLKTRRRARRCGPRTQPSRRSPICRTPKRTCPSSMGRWSNPA